MLNEHEQGQERVLIFPSFPSSMRQDLVGMTELAQ